MASQWTELSEPWRLAFEDAIAAYLERDSVPIWNPVRCARAPSECRSFAQFILPLAIQVPVPVSC
jgi:hypothetical protein